MSGIAGIAREGERVNVEHMLHRIEHRGAAGHRVFEVPGATLGVVWTKSQGDSFDMHKGLVRDYVDEGHYAQAQVAEDGIALKRDPLGAAPLYHGQMKDGAMCFASEVKALLKVTKVVNELPPGHRYDGKKMEPFFQLKAQTPLNESPEVIAKELRRRLEAAVTRCISEESIGAWLSGGLDSSAIAALARPHVKTLYTFAGGLPDAPDLKHAASVAEAIKSEHREIRIGINDVLVNLPEVIYHLESFDALLVRSSIMNFLVSRTASCYVSEVFSGEGGDELFAGYDYLRSIAPQMLADELIDITGRLHNTALQRVDRCASAHGLVAHVSFLDPQVVDYALRIPTAFKIHNNVGKWILRQSMDGLLPPEVLNRKKVKFWEGCGIGDLLSVYADGQISDSDFVRERVLPNGWRLNTKEELLYYRIFKEHFGCLENMDWMGRTKSVSSDRNSTLMINEKKANQT